ncbi:hypothetical protein V494_01492 [Pseudogymnoascus sp. VKM F-4513 (FW-928)]|nr:hypothetical protein V494_01492 [Pseudogymnoascus sp. VKM F-4513 (FW-928)]
MRTRQQSRMSKERKEKLRLAEDAAWEADIEESVEESDEEWSLSPGGPKETRETSWSSDWSISSGSLIDAKKEQEEEDAKIAERMEEEDIQLEEEMTLSLEWADDDYRRRVWGAVIGAVYDGEMKSRCNKMLRKAIMKQEQCWKVDTGNVMPSTEGGRGAFTTETYDRDVRDREAVEATANVFAADENDQLPLMTGAIPAESPILDERFTAMDGGTTPVSKKLVPRLEHHRVVSGTDAMEFTDDVADACYDMVEAGIEAGKFCMAVKAAICGLTVWHYEFFTEEAAVIIAGSLIFPIVEELGLAWSEHKQIRNEETATDTTSWTQEHSALKIPRREGVETAKNPRADKGGTPSSKDAKGPPEDPARGPRKTMAPPILPPGIKYHKSDTSQLPIRGRMTGQGTARGKSSSSGRGGRGGKGRRGEQMGSREETTETTSRGAVGSAGESSSQGPKRPQTRILPPGLEHYASDTRHNKGSMGRGGNTRGESVRGRGGSMRGESMRGESMRGESMRGESMRGEGLRGRGTVRGIGVGSSQGFAKRSTSAETPMPPLPDKSSMVDRSQLGIRNRQRVLESRPHATQGAATGFAANPLPPTTEKSFLPDASQLGKRKRQSAPEAIGGHRKATKSVTWDVPENPFPPTTDEYLLPDASRPGKRKRQSAPDTTGIHLQTPEGVSEDFVMGSNNNESSLRSTLGTTFGLDPSQLPGRDRRRGTGRGREEGNKRARPN